MKERLRELPGVSEGTERLVLEILETGRSSYHEQLLADAS